MNTQSQFSMSDMDASWGMLHSGLKICIGKCVFVFLCKKIENELS